MGINTIETAKIFCTQLDKLAEAEALTGWMDANAGQVIYTGGAEVKVPKLSMNGLGDYDRDNGYAQGAINYSYQTRTMTQDRGRKFSLDAMDVDETNFVLTASTVMGEFQRKHVVPEIDAYRLSKLASTAITNSAVEYGYTPDASTVLAKVKAAISALRDAGFDDIVMHANGATILALELALANRLESITWSRGGIDTTVPAIDEVPIIRTPQNRLYTKIALNDGTTSGQTAGGYTKASDGKDVNFIVVGKKVPISVTKQDVMRIFDPETNQNANAWAMDYRRFHDLWVLDNQVAGVFVNVKDAASA